jgi:hypothetical protein
MPAPVIEQAAHASSALARARAIRREVARRDARTFCPLVLRDERTGKDIVQAPMHDKWHDILDNHDRVVIWAHVEAGKTAQLSVGRPLWRLGRDPNRRIVVVSNTGEQAKKVVRTCAQYIERSDELHQVFPDLRKARDISLPWTAMAITVERTVIGKDPSIQACGIHGNITGARIDDLVLDDILDYENTRTPGPREDTWRWVQSTLLPRLTENSSVTCVGNAWHPDDAMHRLAAMPGFTSYRFPVVSDAGELSWPAVWPKERIAKAMTTLGPLEANRQLLCLARDDAAARFKREWVERGLERGRGYKCVDRVVQLPEGGYALYTGVDLAVQRHAHSDLTCFFTLLLHPDGTRQVLHIESGRWSGPEIVAKLVDLDQRFGGVFIIENVAAQDFLLQFAPALGSKAVIVPFTTGRNKANPEFGVESLAAEMAGGRWIIPNVGGKMDPEVAAWVGEMLYYDPQEHTGDRLMASWFAREGARKLERGGAAGAGSVGARVVG